MKKIKFTLKWKFTLLTVIIMTIASGILVTAINYDINRRIPQLADIIIGETGVEPIEDGYLYFGLAQNTEPDNYIIQTDDYTYDEENSGKILPTGIDIALGETVSNIYTTSIIAFIVIIILGAFTTYFIVDRALKPVVKLNENIKDINENNLTANLEVKGSNDEIKELTISFNKMLAKLDNAFDSQKRFNSSIAHELKTPLAVIKTNIDVLNSCKNKTIEEYEETLNVVEKSILKMNSMIETMLDIVRQENAPLNEEINITDIIEDVVEDLNVIADKNNVKLETNISKVNNHIMGNEILLYRAFYNVVENAIKYNKYSGEVYIRCIEEESSIKITILDTGKGIEEKDFENIFKPFYRCEGMNIYSNNGVGLGLSLTKSAIMLHGGEIKIYSEVDKGTEFSIILPVILQ